MPATAASGSGSSTDGPPTAKPGIGSILGGALLVGAAAGYALIAFRFKNMHGATRGAGSAEMRAAGVFSDQATRAASVDWSAEARAARRAAETEAKAEAARRLAEEQASARASREEGWRRRGFDVGAATGRPAPTKALDELGLADVPLHSLNPDAVKEAYRAKARTCHPDVSGADPEAFKRLGKAREEVLQHLDTR